MPAKSYLQKETDRLIQTIGKIWPLEKVILLKQIGEHSLQCVFCKDESLLDSMHNLQGSDVDIHSFIKTHLGCNFVTKRASIQDEKYYIALSCPNPLKEEAVTVISDLFLNLWLNTNQYNRYQKRKLQTDQLISEMTVIHEISRAFDGSRSLDSLLAYIVEKAKILMRAESASLMLVTADGKALEFKVVLGPKSEEVKPFRLEVGKGIAGWVAKNQEPILIPDAYKDSRFDPTFDKRSGYKTRSILTVPMIYKNETVGVMTIINRDDFKPFVEDDKNTMLTFARQAALAIENARLLVTALEKERLDNELKVASEIQQRLIPQTIPKVKNLEISATYIPCKEVSGDFYDIIKLDDARTAFVVADVAGKGIPAAMLVSTMQATLSVYLEEGSDLVSIVERLNNQIIKKSTADRFITFFIGIYDAQTDKFTFVNAGHNPPILQSGKNLKLLEAGGLFIGSLPWEYKSNSIDLCKGDVLTLYTDGLVEAANAEQDEYSEEALIKVIQKNARHASQKILASIKKDVNNHVQKASLDDDFTLVVIKRI